MRILAWPGPETAVGNPYIRLLYTGMTRHDPAIKVEEFSPRKLLFSKNGRVIWHMHWPESVMDLANTPRMLLDLAALLFSVLVARLRGVRIVWTIHNHTAHEARRPRLERWVMHRLVSRLDGVIALTASGAAEARTRYPALERKAIAVIPHGHYMDTYPNNVSSSAARSDLGLDEEHRVILFFGEIRRYKNVPELIRTFRGMVESDLRLIVAGRPASEELAHEIRVASEGDPRIHLHLRWIDPDEVQRFMNAADLVVLPFAEILNSGSALLALSFQRPILVPALGAMAELREVTGEDFVMLYTGALEADHLCDALVRVTMSPPNRRTLRSRLQRRLGWDVVAARTHAFFETLLVDGDLAAAPTLEAR